jgi:hypothetical protein
MLSSNSKQNENHTSYHVQCSKWVLNNLLLQDILQEQMQMRILIISRGIWTLGEASVAIPGFMDTNMR